MGINERLDGSGTRNESWREAEMGNAIRGRSNVSKSRSQGLSLLEGKLRVS